MSRPSLTNEVMGTLSKSHWGIGLTVAVVFWIAGTIVGMATPIGAPVMFIFMIGEYGLKFLAVVAFVAAVISGIRQLNRPTSDVQSPTFAYSPPRDPRETSPKNEEPSSPSCPLCNAPMVLRTARRGANAGNSFYGCTRYPECRGIRNA